MGLLSLTPAEVRALIAETERLAGIDRRPKEDFKPPSFAEIQSAMADPSKAVTMDGHIYDFSDGSFSAGSADSRYVNSNYIFLGTANGIRFTRTSGLTKRKKE